MHVELSWLRGQPAGGERSFRERIQRTKIPKKLPKAQTSTQKKDRKERELLQRWLTQQSLMVAPEQMH